MELDVNDSGAADVDAGAGGGSGDAGGAGSAADFLGGAGESGAGGSGDADAGASKDGVAEGGAAEGGTADPDWYANLSADADGDSASNRDWIKAKGFKDIDGVAKALRGAEKGIHESGRVKVPGEDASDEDRAAFNKAIGVPDDPKGYELPVLKGEDGEPIALNTARLDRITANAHKAGVPKAALEAILQEEVQSELDEASTAEGELIEKAKAHVKGWGAESEAKLAAVDGAMGQLGLTKQEGAALRGALGPSRALDMLASIGAGLAEDTLTGGGEARKFGISGAEAQAELDRLKSDASFQAKVDIPGSAERQRWERLQEAAGAAADRKQHSGG